MAAVHMLQGAQPMKPIRILCGIVAAVVIADAINVQAPFLSFVSIPFIVAAIGMRRGRTFAIVATLAFATLFVYLAGSGAIANGFDATWGDLLSYYVGGPVALGVAVLCVRRLIVRS